MCRSLEDPGLLRQMIDPDPDGFCQILEKCWWKIQTKQGIFSKKLGALSGQKLRSTENFLNSNIVVAKNGTKNNSPDRNFHKIGLGWVKIQTESMQSCPDVTPLSWIYPLP